jgi:nitroimidazol reductase NimA-like FMN-containing flavoprotein (pyridoxamine 5'-phosphate oxidase superfamily)
MAEGMTRLTSGPWDKATIVEYLASTCIPIRIATNGSSGPLVQSLWFTSRGLELWCCTQKSSLLTKRLERDDRVGFEVAADTPPYRGVRGTGVAHLVHADVESTLRTLIERYQGTERTELSDWLLSRIDSETAIRIEPRTIASWDFSHRMKTKN